MNSSGKVILNDNYWPQVLIALAQVTFGVAWAPLFLPNDTFQMTVIVLNLLIIAWLINLGNQIRRKRE